MYQLHTIDDMINEYLREMPRMAIGFEPTLRRLQLTKSQTQTNSASGYPPFNLEKVDENQYRITMAVAGFGIDDLDITVTDKELTVTGDIKSRDEGRTFIHKGIAERSFSRSFILADHVSVEGASCYDGILTIDLQHDVPEELKPRKIDINGAKIVNAKKLTKAA
jgi:molecular chaperone IbpA